MLVLVVVVICPGQSQSRPDPNVISKLSNLNAFLKKIEGGLHRIKDKLVSFASWYHGYIQFIKDAISVVTWIFSGEHLLTAAMTAFFFFLLD